MYYKSFPDNNGYIYSLDNVRLNYDCGGNAAKLVKYLMHINDYDDRFSITYFHSLKNFTYRHLWVINLSDEVSFSLTLDFLGVSDSHSKGWIDFNPNKVEKFSHFKEIWGFIRSFCFSIELVRYDLAIDLPYSRSSCRLIRQGKKLYSYLQKDDGITEYSGRRSTCGFIKLYDKTIESKLFYPLTRLEITLDKSADFSSYFPEVWIYDKQNSLILDNKLSNTQKVLVQAIRQADVPTYLYTQLDGHTRLKLRPFLADKVLAEYKNSWLQVKLLALSYEK